MNYRNISMTQIAYNTTQHSSIKVFVNYKANSDMRNFIDNLFRNIKMLNYKAPTIRYGMAFNWHSTGIQPITKYYCKITIKVHNFYQLNDIFHKNYRVTIRYNIIKAIQPER